jgi:hypothetical protein
MSLMQPLDILLKWIHRVECLDLHILPKSSVKSRDLSGRLSTPCLVAQTANFQLTRAQKCATSCEALTKSTAAF